jgi:hypothetical protein
MLLRLRYIGRTLCGADQIEPTASRGLTIEPSRDFALRANRGRPDLPHHARRASRLCPSDYHPDPTTQRSDAAPQRCSGSRCEHNVNVRKYEKYEGHNITFDSDLSLQF